MSSIAKQDILDDENDDAKGYVQIFNLLTGQQEQKTKVIEGIHYQALGLSGLSGLSGLWFLTCFPVFFFFGNSDNPDCSRDIHSYDNLRHSRGDECDGIHGEA